MVLRDFAGDDADTLPAANLLAGMLQSEERCGMTILDGHGGALVLDLSRPELHLLGDACGRLLAGDVPRHASVIKVRCGEHCYILSRQSEDTLRIVNFFDPAERVILGLDLARIVAGMLESATQRAKLS